MSSSISTVRDEVCAIVRPPMSLKRDGLPLLQPILPSVHRRHHRRVLPNNPHLMSPLHYRLPARTKIKALTTMLD